MEPWHTEILDYLDILHFKLDSLYIITNEVKQSQTDLMNVITWIWKKSYWVIGIIAGIYGKDFLHLAARSYLHIKKNGKS